MIARNDTLHVQLQPLGDARDIDPSVINFRRSRRNLPKFFRRARADGIKGIDLSSGCSLSLSLSSPRALGGVLGTFLLQPLLTFSCRSEYLLRTTIPKDAPTGRARVRSSRVSCSFRDSFFILTFNEFPRRTRVTVESGFHCALP